MLFYLGDNNRRVKMSMQRFIDSCEFDYYARCREKAELIADHCSERPVVLISGPSGSGKTTTAIVLEHFLLDWGYKAHTISLDNYFCDLTPEQMKLAKEGKFSLETPSRIDSEFLNSQLCDILQCKAVEMPRYNFATSTREKSGWTFKREKNEVIIFEGTHALNPDVITVNENSIFTIYVSIRSSITDTISTLVSPQIRLARRLLRDYATRGHSLENTINIYNKVNEGEDLYIKPYMERCHHSIDTFIPYEINLYRSLLYDPLQEYADNKTVSELLSVLQHANGINQDLIPNNSLMREFIGGSVLKY